MAALYNFERDMATLSKKGGNRNARQKKVSIGDEQKSVGKKYLFGIFAGLYPLALGGGNYVDAGHLGNTDSDDQSNNPDLSGILLMGYPNFNSNPYIAPKQDVSAILPEVHIPDVKDKYDNCIDWILNVFHGLASYLSSGEPDEAGSDVMVAEDAVNSSIYPKPDYRPHLYNCSWKYISLNISDEQVLKYPESYVNLGMHGVKQFLDEKLAIAKDPCSYITPDNDWVKHYASMLYFDYVSEDVRFKEHLSDDEKGCKCKTFRNVYLSDSIVCKDRMNCLNNSNQSDLWINPDLYLSEGTDDGFVGDCEDHSIALVSMLQSGQMSVNDSDGNLVKRRIPAVVVAGYSGGSLHYWVESELDGDVYVVTVTSNNTVSGRRDKVYPRGCLVPVYMFDEQMESEYRADWWRDC